MVKASTNLPTAWIGRYLYHVRTMAAAVRGSRSPRCKSTTITSTPSATGGGGLPRPTVRTNPTKRAKYYERAIARNPRRAELLGFSELEADKKENDQAIATLKRGLAAVGKLDLPTLRLTLVSTYLSAGKLSDADQLLNVVAKQLDSQETRLPHGGVSPLRSAFDALRGQWHLEQHQYSQAAVLLKRSVMEHPSVSKRQDVISRLPVLYAVGTLLHSSEALGSSRGAFQGSCRTPASGSRRSLPLPSPGKRRVAWTRPCGNSVKPSYAPMSP